MIAFTTSDLWPGEGWNFVFGQASLQRPGGRVVDLSQRRPGRERRGLPALPAAHAEDRHARDGPHVLDAALHALRVQHVRQQPPRGSRPPPLGLCPHCLAKLCYATGADPQKRFQRLIEFCKANGLKAEQVFYEKSLAAMRGDK